MDKIILVTQEELKAYKLFSLKAIYIRPLFLTLFSLIF